MTRKPKTPPRPRRAGRQQRSHERMELAVTSAGRRRVIAQWPAGLGRILLLAIIVIVLALIVAPDLAARVGAAIVLLARNLEK
jgi:hypothetical protein